MYALEKLSNCTLFHFLLQVYEKVWLFCSTTNLSLSLRTMTFFFLIYWFFVLMIQFQGAEVVRMYKTLLGSQGFRKVRFRICLSLNLIMWYKCLVHYIAADLWVSMYTISPLSGHGSLFQETWWASCNLWRFFCCHARCKWCWFC